MTNQLSTSISLSHFSKIKRDESVPVDFDYFKQLPLYSEVCFVPELVMIGFHQNILASLDESSELLMDKEILNLSPTEEERASLKFNVPIGNTSSITLDSSFEFVNLLDYEVFEQVSVEFGGDFQISLGIEPSFDSHLSTRQMSPTTHMLDEIIKPCSENSLKLTYLYRN
ncbi:unnamed protein product [Oikopleura dioica]|uniref:Uncharacterized protein n=1 Tax=Oikopleura dioica TaxID=34765 RepID=E4XY69_OIKDI|nr:unnamed protein product [Oikopleura dioica]